VLIPGLCVVALVGIALGSLLPAGLHVLPWHAPQWTHVLVYAGLAVLVHLAFGFGRRSLLLTVLVVGGAGLVLELGQAFVPVREFSLQDAALNFFGALIGVLVFELMAWIRPKGESASSAVGPTDQQSSRLAREVAAMSEERLLAAGPLLLRQGKISPQVAALARQVQQSGKPLGNRPADDRVVLQALDADGVRCLVLKGTLLAHLVYDAPDQRSRGDTDILVAPQDRSSAETTLQRLGLKPSWLVTAKTSDTQDQWQGRLDGNLVVIDLHWHLLNHAAFSDLFVFEALWSRRAEVEIDGFRAAGPGLQDALLHAVLHYFAHHGDEFRPAQWLLDIHLLWLRMDDANRYELVRRSADLGIAGLVAEALDLTRNRFESPVPDETLKRLKAQGANQWRTGLLKAGSGPFSDQLFKLRAAGSWRARLAHLRALLFPSAQYMRSKYPGSSRWALPWLYVRRMVEGSRK